MILTDRTRQALALRRQEKGRLLKAGYRRHETDWEIHRGMRYREVIVDAVISTDGKYVYTKLGLPAGEPSSLMRLLCDPGAADGR